MALRKARYLHLRRNLAAYRKYNGVTILMSPVDDPTKVKVGISFCAKDDQFCKETGRQLAQREETSHITEVTKLPLVIARAAAMMDGYKIDPRNERYYANNYAWIWKYFL